MRKPFRAYFSLTVIAGLTFSAYSLALLFIIQTKVHSVLANGLVGAIDQIVEIAGAVMIGNMIGRRPVRSLLLYSTILMALVAWIPAIFLSSHLFYLVAIIVDLFLSLALLVERLARPVYLMRSLGDDEAFSYISSLQQYVAVGGIAGFIIAAFLVSDVSVPWFFVAFAATGMGLALVLVGLPNDVGRKTSLAGDVSSSRIGINMSRLAVALNGEYTWRLYLVSVAFDASVAVFLSLIIYFVGRIDPRFMDMGEMIAYAAVGPVLSIVITSVLKGKKALAIATVFAGISISLSLIFLAEARSIGSAGLLIGIFLGGAIFGSSVLSGLRTTLVKEEFQGVLLGHKRFFSALLSVFVILVFSTFIPNGFRPALVYQVEGLIMLLVTIIYFSDISRIRRALT